jgi:CheY-like chemotaxis protein
MSRQEVRAQCGVCQVYRWELDGPAQQEFADLHRAARVRFRACPDASRSPRCQTRSVQPAAVILVVDDHVGFRVFARRLLEAAGFTVAEAATGVQAAEAVRAVRPGLVLLDIQLPDFDGFEVARRLAAQAGSSVIVLTSTREASDYGGLIAASPAAGFLPKDQLSGAALRGFLTRSSA